MRKGFLVIIAALFMLKVNVFAYSAVGSVPSDWAVSQIEEAKQLGIITPRAQMNYLAPLTREGYCELVVVMLERLLGYELPAPPINPFNDTANPSILKAYEFGVTAGLTQTTFGPTNNITREQVAAMTVRALQNAQFKTGTILLEPPARDLLFADRDQIESYALESMKYSTSNNIFVGDQPGGTGYVFPKNFITSQECVLVVTRSYKSGAAKMQAVAPSPSPSPSEQPSPSPEPSTIPSTYYNIDDFLNGLQLKFAPGDSQNSVTQDIIMPTAPQGVTLSFTTSNNIVTPDGRVSSQNVGSMPISVVLTATVTMDNVVKTKPFTIIVVNPNAKDYRDISFYDVRLGEAIASVMSRIGQPQKTIRLDGNTYWAIYHNSYADYFQLLVVNNYVQEIFACSEGLETKLKDLRTNQVISIDDVSRTRNITSTRYVDQSNKAYALDIVMDANLLPDYNINISASEQVAFEIINALRKRANAEPFVWNESLGRSARKHSENMYNNKFFSITDTTGRGFYDRIKAELDFETTLRDYDEIILSNLKTPQEAACSIYANPAQKYLMTGVFSSVGIGYYQSFFTFDLAVLFNQNLIQSITMQQPITVNVGEKKPLNYTISPIGVREYISNVYSSNPQIVTYNLTTNTLEGISPGKANLTFVGSMGFNRSYEVTVTGIVDPNVITSIKMIGPDRNSINIGNSIKLDYQHFPTTAPKPTVTWSIVNNTTAVTIDQNGNVTALHGGVATIMAATSDPNIFATTVVDVPASVLNSINITNNNIHLSVGGKSQALVNFNPSDARSTLSWASSDPRVAIVDENGVITAIAPGSAIITAATGGKAAATAVNVVSIVKNITDMTIISSSGNSTMNIGTPLTLYVTRSPIDTNEMILWSSDNEAVVRVDAFGNLTAIRAGQATITARSASGLVIRQMVIYVQ